MGKIAYLEDILIKNRDCIEPDHEKRYGENGFESDEIKYKLEFFNTGQGLGYCQSSIDCRNFIRHSHTKGVDYSFLFFNTGSNPIRFKFGEKPITLKSGEFWIGCMNEDFFGSHEFQNKRYFSQFIAVHNNLASQLKIFKNLAPQDKITIKSGYVDPIQSLILKELANSKIYEGKMREIFMESKILEMIYRSFAEAAIDKKREFDDKEIDILNKAKRILLSDIQNPPSIKELARLCATNDFKLKSDFKRYFGTTIYGMLQDERLSVAKELLRSNDISVKEAAKSVGYASAPHFAKIFREKFSILPTQLSKKKSYHTAS